MTWGFIWLMLVLKIPIGMLLYIVWWAIKQDTTDLDDDGSTGGDGGTKVYPHGDRRPALPRWPRGRGPHGEPVPSPPRSRTPAPVVARARETEQR